MLREEVIRRIVERDLSHSGLSEDVVLEDAQALHEAACEHFGTWNTALKYAGIRPCRVITESQYAPEYVLRRICQLCYNGYNMSAKRNAQRDRRLCEAAIQHFGSWRRAMQEAGIHVEHVRRCSTRRPFNQQEIIDQLRQRHEAGQSLDWRVVCLENRVFARAAKNTFHSWQCALAAAGLAAEKLVTPGGPKWNRVLVLEAIQAQKQAGKPLTYSATLCDHPSLISAAQKYFGNWTKARIAAGCAPEE
jgi:hypothetical protein